MVSKSSDSDLLKIYKRAEDYFKNRTSGFVVESPVEGRSFKFRKIGSDLNFRLVIGDNERILLEVTRIASSMMGGSAFHKEVAGTIEYLMNGNCENKIKLTPPNKRQQLELQEIIDHVQKSIRPNSINFIMDD